MIKTKYLITSFIFLIILLVVITVCIYNNNSTVVKAVDKEKDVLEEVLTPLPETTTKPTPEPTQLPEPTSLITKESIPEPTTEPTPKSSPIPKPTKEPEKKEVETSKDNVGMSQKDIELIALMTMAEAEGESEKGMRLVIDVVLNRMDHPKFPDTVSGVIYQKHQFSGMQPPRINKCYVRDDIVKLAKEELKSRTNSKVIFFRTKYYSNYGTPLFKVDNHYFSSY